MGLAKFENSMFYLNHGKNFKDGAFSLQKFSAENRLYLVIFLPKNEKRTFNMRVC